MSRTIKRLSDHVKYIWSHIHYLKGFTGWDKRKGSRSVHFETTYPEVKIKKVVTYVEEVTEHKVTITIPPQSLDPYNDAKIYFGANVPAHKRKELKETLEPKIKKFILRNSL